MDSKVLCLLVLIGVSFLGCAQNRDAPIVPESYVAYKTPEPLIIDGEDADEAWGRVAWTEPFVDIEGIKKPKYKTRVKMLWDDTYFYILAHLEEPHVWGNLVKRDTIIFHNNDFEVFIDPDSDTYNYYELEVNALNTPWDLFLSKPYRDGNVVLNDWNITGLKSAVKVNGTINDPTDVDKGWVLEMAIPWEAYKKGYYHNNVPKDTFWRVNFSRVNWDFELVDGEYQRKKNDQGRLLHEYNWVWSAMGVINMHEPEKWGYVYFSSKEPGDKEVFAIPSDEKIKWKLFELYRAQKAYFETNGKWADSLDDLQIGNRVIEGKVISPTLENHSQGWNIMVDSPFSGKRLIVKEDGEFIEK
ncbi:sugar-binding protein [Maribacter polysaccharolyticus]|uniref:sugar-binding protein n=1 Tax=Maribacter polysaccharolyticus TaxID=3020831 RepID=UPI00237FA67C|nr:sugar-binding protein [Maribacter polysaccharolyticus]MDE3742049.1 sugar-binding protein [Maribacter polysaccharolyticus]